MKKHKTTKTLIVALIVALVMGATYAFTASNTVPNTSAGSGGGTISGYTVSNIAYTNSGTNFATVTFDLDKAAGHVEVSFDGGTTTTSCGGTTGTGPYVVSCTVSDSITSANSLTVVSLS